MIFHYYFSQTKCNSGEFSCSQNETVKKSATNRTNIEETQFSKSGEESFKNFESDKKCAFQASHSTKNILTLDRSNFKGIDKNKEILEKKSQLTSSNQMLPSQSNDISPRMISTDASQVAHIFDSMCDANDEEKNLKNEMKDDERLTVKVGPFLPPFKKIESTLTESEDLSKNTTPTLNVKAISAIKASSNDYLFIYFTTFFQIVK